MNDPRPLDGLDHASLLLLGHPLQSWALIRVVAEASGINSAAPQSEITSWHN